MMVGLQTNFCIDASVKSAFERGFQVIIPAGTNSTFDNDYMDGETTYRYYNEMMWPERFAQCVSVEEALADGFCKNIYAEAVSFCVRKIRSNCMGEL